VSTFANRGYRLHGFGVKVGGLRRIGHLLQSADSLAWSYAARKREVRLSDEAHAELGVPTHSGVCNNCYAWAATWREDVLQALRDADAAPRQEALDLFAA
jgi:hypothetical protein